MLVRTLVAKWTVSMQVIFTIRNYAVNFNTMLFPEEVTECKVEGRCL